MAPRREIQYEKVLATAIFSDIVRAENVEVAVKQCLFELDSDVLFKRQEFTMLHYALVFLVIALVAAIFGFGGVYVAAAGIAKVLFFLFLVLFVVSLLMGRRVAP